MRSALRMVFCTAICILSCYATLSMLPAAESDSTKPAEGLRKNSPNVHALVGARIVLGPGRELEAGVLVIRDGIITAVGADEQAPADARVWDLSGKWIYPGFIDSFDEIDVPADSADRGAAYWNEYVQPQRLAASRFQHDAGLNKQLRSQGITSRLIAPQSGIIKGSSALVTTADAGSERVILAEEIAMHAQLTVPRSRNRRQYPNSPMGAVALVRQTFYDAQWYRDAWRAYQAQRGLAKPERNRSLQALQPYLDGQKLVVVEAPDEQYLLRADRFGREFGLNVVVLGSGHEYRRIADVRRANRPIILPLGFPKPPNVATAEATRDVSLEDLMHWDHAPENPARLRQAGLTVALTTHGLAKKEDFLPALRKAVQRGLSAQEALRALTEVPARLFGVGERLGSLDQGKLAHLVVADGDLFADKTAIVETWIDGTRYIVKGQPRHDLRGVWELQRGGKLRQFKLSGKPSSLKGNWITTGDEKQVTLKNIRLSGTALTATFDAKLLDEEGIARITLVVVPNDEQWRLMGHYTSPSGRRTSLTAVRLDDESTEADKDDEESSDGDADVDEEGDSNEEGETKSEGDEDESSIKMASFPVNIPLGAFGRRQSPEQPEWLVLEHATVWTCGPQGILHDATIVVHKGIIERVGVGLKNLPEQATVIDCGDKFITPGIIDCHSHMATDGGVNESAQVNTAEVRIGDFIDARDISIYRQLAGGVTTANVLHGSANPIGGQNQVIKLRWGASPEGMKFTGAPAGIKFALGENVKQSNWRGEYSTRYPQTRMGVEQIIRDTFQAARQYRYRQEQWTQNRQGLPPRRDLELDAIAEILEKKRWIHCHSYRQDEILALLRTLESFDIQIGTLQHILEGYKVADAMQQHGAMASAFSDWWAYKVEVYDAIPYNGVIMHDMGIVVSFNSDDRELARHLNHEAAKAVKYGGVAPQEALNFVTLNPARQLRIDQHVGSVEPGKHADLVVWSGPPLSTRSRCEQTWIEGRKYFDIDEDRTARSKWQNMRNVLVQKILRSGEEMSKPGEKEPSERELWPRHDTFCHTHDGHGHGDLHEQH